MKKLCVIFGGASSEHDISIITGLQLIKNLKEKYDLSAIYFGLDNRFYLTDKFDMTYYSNKEKIKLPEIIISNGSVYRKKFFKKMFDINIIINCCHGGAGENGDLAGFFETNNIRYTSANSLSSHIAMDKNLAKTLVKDKVQVVNGLKVTKENLDKTTKIIKKEYPNNLIVKPNSLGSSIGVKACNKNNFKEQIEAIFELQDDALVEEQITNMIELNQACLKTKEGLLLSAIEQPITKNDFLTFSDKYKHGKTKGKDRIIPAEISAELEQEIIEATQYVYTKLNLSGIVRIDYIYDLENKILYFNEVNTIPGSMAYYLYEPIGIDYITLIEKLIDATPPPHKYSYFDTHVLTKNIL